MGILRVDKPEGPTSHDIVARARRALGTRRVGHTGTLDPFASGLLLLCVGDATRLSEVLTGLPKVYVAEALLGIRTDTDDREGVPVEVREGAERLGVEEVDVALAAHRGSFLQTPPIYSAKKMGGERLHRRARRGEAVEPPPVRVEVFALERLEWSPPRLRFRVHCSSGTYIRALARDLGEALGVGGHLNALRRTQVGPHGLAGAVSGDRLEDALTDSGAWIPLPRALAHLPHRDVTEREALELRRGRRVGRGTLHPGEGEDQAGGGPVALFQGDGLVALAERRGDWLQPRRVFPA